MAALARPTSSGHPNVPMAAKVSREVAAWCKGGWGCWEGLGISAMSRNVSNVPVEEKRSWVQAKRITSRDSPKRARLSS
jgi:hypothetical protein